MTRNKITILLLFLLLLSPVYGQTIDEARALYANNKYEEAKPMFAKFLKSYPNNANYNFWYGVCALKTHEPEEAVKPLELANKRRVPDAALHLSNAYLATYRFEEAIDILEAFIKTESRRRRNTDHLEEILEQSKLNFRMLKGVEQVIVIDSIVVDKSNFIDTYRLSEESGILSYYSNGNSDALNPRPTSYQTERGNKLYHSTINGAGFYQLYMQTKLGDEWSESKPITELNKDSVNLNYPFVLNDGVTLTYATDDKRELGGYDIMVTRYNTNTDSYLVPENVGMPFNSIYNDYMYAIDEFNNLGWFASDRFQPKDKVCIYIFIPNKVKRTYSYESLEIEELRKLASLENIKLTWKDEQAVKDGLQRLQFALTYRPTTEKSGDFNFIVNDYYTYTSLKDFKTNQGREEFMKLQVMERDYKDQKKRLDQIRAEYNKESDKNKAPAIIDLENRLMEMAREINKQYKLIRSLELTK